MSQKIYHEILMEHNLYPQYQGELQEAEICERLVNASCGDELTVMLKVEKGVIVAGRFKGQGCAIAKASADLMLTKMIGRKIEEVKKIAEKFEKMVMSELQEAEIEGLGELGAMAEVARMPARIKCAKLAWQIVNSLH